MTVHLTREQEQRVEAIIQSGAYQSVEDVVEAALTAVEHDALPSFQNASVSDKTGRQEAVRRMLEFGDKYHLSLGEPVTRKSLHEGHRF